MVHNMKEQSDPGGDISRRFSRIYSNWDDKDPKNLSGHKNTALKNKCLALCLQNPNSGGSEKSKQRRDRWHKITI